MATLRTKPSKATCLVLANCVSLAVVGAAHAQAVPIDPAAARLDQLEDQIEQQSRVIEQMRAAMAEQENGIAELRNALADERLDDARAKGGLKSDQWSMPASAVAAIATTAVMGPRSAAGGQSADENRPADERPSRPVGRAPESDSRPPEIAQIFDQPGVLTPRGKFVLEPSFQFGYSANDRVALVGYTIIPALLIGLIDVRQVKTTSATATLTGRFGLTNRMEVEARLPYVYVNGDTVSREIFTGSAQDKVFNASGRGLGDVEATLRYQFNDGGADKPFYIGWLRYKARTGKDIFEVVTDCVTRCVANATGTGLPLELPTGTGFASVQPGLTWLFPSDPVVFFGNISYLHNFKRSDVSRTVLSGAPAPFPPTSTDLIGEVKPGDIIGFNVGMGLALNEKAAISIGYDQSIVGKTEQNGVDAPGAVRIILGTLLLGGSYRFSERTTLNVALGVGVTRDTPDISLTVRVPFAF